MKLSIRDRIIVLLIYTAFMAGVFFIVWAMLVLIIPNPLLCLMVEMLLMPFWIGTCYALIEPMLYLLVKEEIIE